MASVGSLSVSSIEEAFGLKPGDLKLVSDTEAPSPFLAKNGWTYLEGVPLRIARLEVIKRTFISTFASIATQLTGGVFEFAPGGKSYDEYLVHNLNRLCNNHVHYEVDAYVNEGCHLLHAKSSSWRTQDKTVEKMGCFGILYF